MLQNNKHLSVLRQLLSGVNILRVEVKKDVEAIKIIVKTEGFVN